MSDLTDDQVKQVAAIVGKGFILLTMSPIEGDQNAGKLNLHSNITKVFRDAILRDAAQKLTNLEDPQPK